MKTTAKLAVATANSGKLIEIESLLEGMNAEVLSLKDFRELPEIVEDGETFIDNALKKARALFAHCGLPTIADDSGLTVDALGGRPGVYSARYAGPGADDLKNIEKLLGELKDAPAAERGCAFVCFLAYVDGRTEKIFEGRLEGRIGFEMRGKRGFGYDPIFVLPDGRTVAELPLDEKNKISHRGQALKKFVEFYRG